MKKKIIVVFVCVLFFATAVLQVSGTINNYEKKSPITMDESYQLSTQSDLETSGCISTVTVIPTARPLLFTNHRVTTVTGGTYIAEAPIPIISPNIR